MKKRVIAALMAAGMMLMMAGCGSDAPKTDSGTSDDSVEKTEEEADAGAESGEAPADAASSGEQVTLRFSWWGGDERLQATLGVIEQFEELHPNVKIEPEYGGSDGYADKLATQLAAGTEPDIMQIDPAYMSSLTMGNTDYFVDLLADGFDFSQFDENYISMRVNGRYDGRQLGIPTGMSGPALLLNQDLVDQLKDEIGFDFTQPFTWDDMIEWGRKVHEYDETLYLIEDNKDMIEAIMLGIYSMQLTGGTYMDEETGQQRLSVEQWTELYTMVQQLYENNVVPPTSYMAAYSGDALQTDPNWIAGKYVGAFCHNSLIANMTAANPDANYSAGNLPVMENAIVGGWKANCPQLMAVSSRSENIKEAEAFLDYFFNDPAAQETLGVVRSTPATSQGREICEKIGVLDPVVAQSASVLEQYTSVETDKLSSSTEVQQILRDQIEAIGFGVTTPEKAAEETLSLLENYVSSLNIQ